MNRAINIHNTRLGSWLRQNKLGTRLILTCLASFIFFCMALGFIINTHHTQQQQIITAHGHTTSQLATSQLTVSMGNNNLIGLQSLLNDLVKQERVVNAVIYDVDNKIIVQSGNINTLTPEHHKAFTSPITLDNTILGSLTITFDTKTEKEHWVIFLLALAAILPIVINILLIRRGIPRELLPPHTNTTTEEPEDISTKNIPIEPTHCSLLVVHIHTLDKLYQQLNAEARQKQFDKLQTTIKKVLTLYSGQQVAASPDCVILRFEDSDITGCSFSALCCAHLLREFSEQQQWLIYLSTILYNEKDNFNAAHNLPALRQYLNNIKKPGELLVTNNSIENSSLSERLQLETCPSNGFRKVIKFSDNHENLLKNQLSHLINT